MISEIYVWPSMKADVTLWARTCLQCQQAKVSRHTRSKLSDFVPPSARFEHVHIDLVGPLPPSEGFRYCLTCVDRFSKWPEAFPLVDISANTIATAFYSGWISRFGPPLRLTTDQGTQFESALFQALTKFLGTARQSTTSYHPAANGQVERFHRQLKAAIMAHGKVQWSSALPTILLGFRATWKEDLEATTADMVYGAPIRLPGEFLSPTTDSPDPSTFVGKLKEVMKRLLPPKTQHHGQHSVFVSKDLSSCSHVFLRTDALRKGLQPPYEGPFQVLDRNEKIFKISKNGKELTVNIDRVKPAYVLRNCDPTRLLASEPPTPQENLQEDRTARTSRPETITRSGRRIRFNPSKLVLQTHSKLALQGGVALVVTANLWQTRFASEGGDSALLVCHSFASSLTRQICHDKIISSKNQTCCKRTCYLGNASNKVSQAGVALEFV
ncbi:Retrovirus-related Pol polyprotein from transposon 412 [Araneus ventricosus]|uniref:Retrovirus-related Pol polyprotein from transposon 412 n=1 Tax=Araneus ventricosus TaxID=182803 RepID=A0A4Y2WND2_ARAVE|nr:Retrovirus-related Pol polyprotein from transposon 412 [Araneus ventricosus]